MDKLPTRKNIRLEGFDYSKSGYYIVTICTNNRKRLLSKIVGGGFHATPKPKLSLIGKEIAKTIEFIQNKYLNICFSKYVIMPNHIHVIIILHGSKTGGHGNPPLPKIIGELKSYTNKRYNDINKTNNIILWQRNYF